MPPLNKKQKEFVTANPDPLITIAGPGTGKTYCLIQKIKFNKGKKILALTFTNKAASEIKERLGNQNKVHVHTFHSFCLQVLRKHKNFEIIPEYQKLFIANKLKSKYSLSKTPKQVLYKISQQKNSTSTIIPDPDPESVNHKIVSDYNQRLRQNNYLDYDDLINQAINLSKKNVPQFDLILVDEFQDTNSKQFDLLNHIKASDNISVIGDPNQSIYSFRGASADIFLDFKNKYTNFKEIIFKINYRSTNSIISVANNIYPKFSLKTKTNKKGELKLIKTPTRLSEAKFIFNTINEKVGGVDILKASDYSASHADCHFKDFAIIYRKHADSKFIRKILDEEGIPVQQIGEESPFNTLKAQKFISALTFINQSGKHLANHFDKPTVNRISSLNTKTNLKILYQSLANVLGFEIPEIADLCDRFSDKSINNLLDYIEKISDIGYWDYLGDKVTLCTIHSAKGLEFKYVFIPQFKSRNFPQPNSDENEEKRLFYVAVTRAKYGLYLMQTGKQSKYNKYLTNLAVKIRDEKGYKSLDRLKLKKIKASQGSLF